MANGDHALKQGSLLPEFIGVPSSIALDVKPTQAHTDVPDPLFYS